MNVVMMNDKGENDNGMRNVSQVKRSVKRQNYVQTDQDGNDGKIGTFWV